MTRRSTKLNIDPEPRSHSHMWCFVAVLVSLRDLCVSKIRPRSEVDALTMAGTVRTSQPVWIASTVQERTADNLMRWCDGICFHLCDLWAICDGAMGQQCDALCDDLCVLGALCGKTAMVLCAFALNCDGAMALSLRWLCVSASLRLCVELRFPERAQFTSEASSSDVGPGGGGCVSSAFPFLFDVSNSNSQRPPASRGISPSRVS